MSYSFILSQKNIPDLAKFHDAVKKVCPDLIGITINEHNVYVELSVPITSEMANLIESVIPPKPRIADVTPRQIRQAMILKGISLSQIDDIINSMPEPQKSLARAEWEYSNAFERDRPLVDQMGHLLGKTDEELDALWLFAKTL